MYNIHLTIVFEFSVMEKKNKSEGRRKKLDKIKIFMLGFFNLSKGYSTCI